MDAGRKEKKIEIAQAILLSVVIVTTAWCSATAIISIVLFIGGILSQITTLRIRDFLLSLDYVIAIVNFGWLLRLPLAQQPSATGRTTITQIKTRRRRSA